MRARPTPHRIVDEMPRAWLRTLNWEAVRVRAGGWIALPFAMVWLALLLRHA